MSIEECDDNINEILNTIITNEENNAFNMFNPELDVYL